MYIQEALLGQCSLNSEYLQKLVAFCSMQRHYSPIAIYRLIFIANGGTIVSIFQGPSKVTAI